jgi:hypothetical protein
LDFFTIHKRQRQRQRQRGRGRGREEGGEKNEEF